MTAETKIQDWLRLFDDDSAAMETTKKLGYRGHRTSRSYRSEAAVTRRLDHPSIEPRYLCTDGRWRKWDNVAKLVAIG